MLVRITPTAFKHCSKGCTVGLVDGISAMAIPLRLLFVLMDFDADEMDEVGRDDLEDDEDDSFDSFPFAPDGDDDAGPGALAPLPSALFRDSNDIPALKRHCWRRTRITLHHWRH